MNKTKIPDHVAEESLVEFIRESDGDTLSAMFDNIFGTSSYYDVEQEALMAEPDEFYGGIIEKLKEKGEL